jgi:hypothetical protein
LKEKKITKYELRSTCQLIKYNKNIGPNNIGLERTNDEANTI